MPGRKSLRAVKGSHKANDETTAHSKDIKDSIVKQISDGSKQGTCKNDSDGELHQKESGKLVTKDNSSSVKRKGNEKPTPITLAKKRKKGAILDEDEKNIMDNVGTRETHTDHVHKSEPKRKEKEPNDKKKQPNKKEKEKEPRKEKELTRKEIEGKHFSTAGRKRNSDGTTRNIPCDLAVRKSTKTLVNDDVEDFESSKRPKLQDADTGGKKRSDYQEESTSQNTVVRKKSTTKSKNSLQKDEPLLSIDEDKTQKKSTRKTNCKKQEGKPGKETKSKEKKLSKGINETGKGCVRVVHSPKKELDIDKSVDVFGSHNETIRKPKVKVDMGDVTSVLLMMEGKSKAMQGPSGLQGKHDDVMDGSSDEEEESDWEEVEALHGHDSPKKSQMPSGPIEITLAAPELMKKRKKKQFDVKAYFQRLANRFQKEQRENIHKVHLMCLLCRGMYLNQLCNHDLLRAQALSVLPQQFTCLTGHQYTPTILSKVLTWYQKTFPFMTNPIKQHLNLSESLGESFRSSTVISHLERALVLIILLRSLGLLTRIVTSLQPFPLKASSAKISSRRTIKSGKILTSEKSKGKESSSHRKGGSKHKSKLSSDDDRTQSKYFPDMDKSPRSKRSNVKPKSYKDKDSEEDLSESSNDESVGKGKDKGGIKKSKTSKKSQTSGSDEDFEEEQFTPRSPLTLVKKVIQRSKNRQILSDDSDVDEISGGDTWTEVFIEQEDQWFSVSSFSCTVTKPHVIESQATKPVHYVFGFDNDGYVKDVTPRYASKWLTETRKLRVNSDWLEETVQPYKCPDSDLHLKENSAIQAKLESQPMPTSVSELKNHPLYVLKRHLLKFEAIYPNSAIPVGYIKNEPVYARECVHVLHSRENWLKEGRAVRVGEEPYKMVKSRARWNKKKENPDALDLETFGFWQTEEYIPPPAYNGKVPRNGYGNIELFKPSMLPAGAVHLKLPGLNKVAKKLNIDCVPAMTGWDSHCGYSHPVLDGFVVCEEFEDVLIAAWDEDQEIQKQREAEKREKRVIQNWTLLTKGLLIKERLKRKYLLQSQEEEKVKETTSNCEQADDLSLAWPMNKEGSQALSNAKHFKSEIM